MARLGGVGYTSDFCEWFTENFHFEGMVTPEHVASNIRWLREQLPDRVQLIIINGAEVISPSALEPDRHEHHAACNQAIDRLIEEVPGIELCDVRKVVSSTDDLTNNLRHYSRRAYFEISSALSVLLADSQVRSKSRAAFVVGEFLAHAERTARKFVRAAINLATGKRK
jgi:hypothetical protein